MVFSGYCGNVKIYITAIGKVMVIWMGQYRVRRWTAHLLIISRGIYPVDGVWWCYCVLLWHHWSNLYGIAQQPMCAACGHSLAPCLSEWTRKIAEVSIGFHLPYLIWFTLWFTSIWNNYDANITLKWFLLGYYIFSSVTYLDKNLLFEPHAMIRSSIFF